MRSIIGLLALTLAGIAAAQPPQLGPGQFFQVGRSYLRFSYEIGPERTAALIAAEGEGYAIDLTWLPEAFLYTSDSISCTAAPTDYANYAAYYDTANVQISITDRMVGGTREHLFLVDDERVQYVGGQPNGAGGSGDDLVFQRYPGNAFETVLQQDIVYGTTWTEPIDGQFYDGSGSDDHFITGTATTVADAAGQITLPDGSLLPHTLRLRTVRDYVDENALFGTIARQDTVYTWWVDSWDAPLMILPIGDYGLMHGYVSPLPFTIYQRLNNAQAIAEHGPEELDLGPNPCTTILRVGTRPGMRRYSVCDASGRVVQEGNMPGNGILDVGRLPSGGYLLRTQGDAVQHGRFIVLR